MSAVYNGSDTISINGTGNTLASICADINDSTLIEDLGSGIYEIKSDRVRYIRVVGDAGVAKFNLTPSNTNITFGKYWYEITWSLTSGEYYVLDSGTVNVLERV